MIPGLQVFSTLRADGVMEQLQDKREMPGDLIMVGRTAIRPSMGRDIMARFVGRAQIADIISDDSPALTYSYGKIDLINYNIPKLKHGVKFTESDMLDIVEMARYASTGDQAAINQLKMTRDTVLDNLLLGIRWRWEALICAMMCDSLHYDRLGIKIDGTWGMPSDLKITVSPAWTSTSATPINDILNTKEIARTRYGIEYDRLTMSRTAFRYAIATTEFNNKAKIYLPLGFDLSNLTLVDIEPMRKLFETVSGCEVTFHDSRYWTQDEDGTESSGRFLPINKVILDSTTNDNNPMVQDLGNAPVLESMMIGTDGASESRGALPAARPGPIAYTYMPPASGEAPTMSMWGVARTYPRKWKRQANAVLTVGNFSDMIAVGEPF